MVGRKMVEAIAVFLIGLGCASSIGIFMGIGIGLFVISILWDRNILDKKYISSKFFVSNFLVVFSFVFVCLTLSLIINNKSGVSESVHYLERILPFLVVAVFFRIKEENYIYAFLGLACGGLIIASDFWYNTLLTNKLRVNSLIGSVNVLGGQLILILPFVFYCLICSKKILIRAFSFSTIFFYLGTILYAASRGTILGLFAMVSIFLVIDFHKRILKLNRLVYILVPIVLLVIAGLAYYYADFLYVRNSSDIARRYIYEASWNMFLANPYTGVGLGQFGEFIFDYINPVVTTRYSHAHNIYLKYLSEIGILGFASFISVILYQVKFSYENIKEKNSIAFYMLLAITGMMVHGLVDSVFAARTYALTYWLVWGITCKSIWQLNLQRNSLKL